MVQSFPRADSVDVRVGHKETDCPPDALSRKLYPRSIKGIFQNWRATMVVLTQLFFYGVPWLNWGDRQAFLLDISAHKFYLFGVIFLPQDIIYLTVLLIICAYSLFLFTAVAGRLWCGYVCPQTVYTELLMWIERAIEGDRNARMRLDAAPWTLSKAAKKLAKHVLWIALALWTGITFMGYFMPMRELVKGLPLGLSGWALFWTLFYGGLVYFLAGTMREQVCKYMCPYARFQSAMLDRDTMIVTYDAARGEPRGVHRGKPAVSESRQGHCVDCGLCVQVCPTGIDIREGLQYECIGCAACIDGCNTVMKKMHLLPGLIRYTTENALAEGLTQRQIWRRVLRLRTLVYSVVLLLIIIATVASLWSRSVLKVDVLRDRGVMAREMTPGVIENIYRLQITNATEQPHHFRIEVAGLPHLQAVVASIDQVSIPGASVRMVPVSVRFQLPEDGWKAGAYPITFTVQAVDVVSMVHEEKSTFIVPKN